MMAKTYSHNINSSSVTGIDWLDRSNIPYAQGLPNYPLIDNAGTGIGIIPNIGTTSDVLSNFQFLKNYHTFAVISRPFTISFVDNYGNIFEKTVKENDFYIDAANKTMLFFKAHENNQLKVELYKIDNIHFELEKINPINYIKYKDSKKKILVEKLKKDKLYIIDENYEGFKLDWSNQTNSIAFCLEGITCIIGPHNNNAYINTEFNILELYEEDCWQQYKIKNVKLDFYTPVTISMVKQQRQERQILVERVKFKKPIETDNFYTFNGTGNITLNQYITTGIYNTAIGCDSTAIGYNSLVVDASTHSLSTPSISFTSLDKSNSYADGTLYYDEQSKSLKLYVNGETKEILTK